MNIVAGRSVIRTRAKEDTKDQGYGWKEGRTELETPCNRTDIIQDKIRREPEHDTKSSLKKL